MYGIVTCKSFYFTKSLLINDIFLRYKCPVKSFAFFLLAFINFWVWVLILFTCYVRDIMPCCFTVIFTLLGCYLVRFQALKTLFLIQDLSKAGSLVVGFQTSSRITGSPSRKYSGLSWQSFYSLPEWVWFSQWGQKKMQKSSLCSLFLIEAHLAHF